MNVLCVGETHLKRCDVFEGGSGDGKGLWERLEGEVVWARLEKK